MGRLKKAVSAILIICIVIFAGVAVLKRLYPLSYYDIVSRNAEIYGIDPLFAMSVIHAESRFYADATSLKDAKGLMQMRGDTAIWCAEHAGLENFTLDKLYEPETNIMLGTWYLDYLSEEFGGSRTLCLAAYNAGMGNVKKWLENPKYSDDGVTLKEIPYPETERYIKKVLNNYAIYKMLY